MPNSGALFSSPLLLLVIVSPCLMRAVNINAFISPASHTFRPTGRHNYILQQQQPLSEEGDSDAHNFSIETFSGPTFSYGDTSTTTFNDNNELLCSLELLELGLILSIAESTIVPGSLGLFARISENVQEAIIPAMSLLVGYAKGTFAYNDIGDKTVGFAITSMDAPVFFNRQLMTMEQAFVAAASPALPVQGTSSSTTIDTTKTTSTTIAGHDVYYNEEEKKIIIIPTNNEPSFARYFVPNNNNEEEDMNVTNFGQYCNDRAFLQGIKQDEYMKRCEIENCVRLVWRLEYDQQANMLKPSWPVSVLSRDMRFSNRDPMELGTTYGWNYWDATVELDRL